MAEGDSVTKGTAVGKTGKTGFTKDNGVHVGMTVFDVPVSPYPAWETEIKIVK